MKVLTMLAVALMLVACGSNDAEKTEKAEPTVGKEIADDYMRDMEKAHAVEDQIMEQKNKMDEALREAEDN